MSFNSISITQNEVNSVQTTIYDHCYVQNSNHILDLSMPVLYRDLGHERRAFWIDEFENIPIDVVVCVHYDQYENTRYYWMKTSQGIIYEVVGYIVSTNNNISISIISVHNVM